MARIPRVFCDIPLDEGARQELPEITSRHILRVLRLRPGDALRLFDGSGREYGGELIANNAGRARIQIQNAGPLEAPPALDIHLVLGISRGQRMDFALQKATELGVTAISPVFTERSVVRLHQDKRTQRLKHWRQVIISACEQSGRNRLPDLNQMADYSQWLGHWQQGGILLDPEAEDTFNSLPTPEDGVVLLVGPEGGLTGEERAAARAQKFRGIRLGPRTLRTETAPLAAIAAAQMIWGDFR